MNKLWKFFRGLEKTSFFLQILFITNFWETQKKTGSTSKDKKDLENPLVASFDEIMAFSTTSGNP